MFQLRVLFICGVIAGHILSLAASPDGSVCLLRDPPNQCGEFCLSALKPLLDHISLHQEDWRKCDVNKINRIDHQRVLQEGQKAMMDTLSQVQATLQILQQTVSKLRMMILPSSTEYIDSKLFFIENNEPKNWFVATNICHDMGGHLVTIQNEDQLTAISARLRQNCGYWIDIRDMDENGEYKSSTSGKAAPFLKWAPGEPNDSKHHCVYLMGGLMHDLHCSGLYRFICQLDD